jgi:hypothetical protein
VHHLKNALFRFAAVYLFLVVVMGGHWGGLFQHATLFLPMYGLAASGFLLAIFPGQLGARRIRNALLLAGAFVFIASSAWFIAVLDVPGHDWDVVAMRVAFVVFYIAFAKRLAGTAAMKVAVSSPDPPASPAA